MSACQFVAACEAGEEEEALDLFERDTAVLNHRNCNGYTGLMRALNYNRHSLVRWLLLLPELNTTVTDQNRYSLACQPPVIL